MNNKVFPLILVALGTAFFAIVSQLAIPIGPVPITLQTLALALIASIYRLRESFLTIVLYLLLGLIGLPIFHGGMSGFAVLAGPTGGFLIAFLIIALLLPPILSLIGRGPLRLFVLNLLGLLLSLLIGSFWLKIYMHISWTKALLTGFAPFVAGEIIKAALASLIVVSLYKYLEKINPYFSEK